MDECTIMLVIVDIDSLSFFSPLRGLGGDLIWKSAGRAPYGWWWGGWRKGDGRVYTFLAVHHEQPLITTSCPISQIGRGFLKPVHLKRFDSNRFNRKAFAQTGTAEAILLKPLQPKGFRSNCALGGFDRRERPAYASRSRP
jgi:hypothetical protein